MYVIFRTNRNCSVHFQLPLIIPITFFVISAFLIVVPCYVAPFEVGMGILITVAGIPIYYFGVIWKDKPKFIQKSIGKSYLLTFQNKSSDNVFFFCFLQLTANVTVFCQKFLVSAKEEC